MVKAELKRSEFETTPGSFVEMLEARWKRGHFVSVGLDSQYDRLPEFLRQGASVEEAIFTFNREIVEATHDLVCAYKPNSAFYEAQGTEGIGALIATVRFIHSRYPEIPVILDAKRNDIGNTSEAYARYVFDVVGADAVTVNPFLGQEALRPFLDRNDKGTFVLCRTSNKGAGELQDLIIAEFGSIPLYQVVAYQVAKEWNQNENCGLVVGAYPDELALVREIAPDLPILIPGIGAQGGDLEATVAAALGYKGLRGIINSSRGIIFASSGEDFAEAARRTTESLRTAINQRLDY